MSELINKHDNAVAIRRKLLASASALALAAYVSSATIARAEDAAQPQIWIELGGQLSRLDDAQEAFEPVFPNSPARPSIFSPSQKFEHPPRFGIDEEGKISFQPESSDWMFSASIRYGKSVSRRNVRQQTSPPPFVHYSAYGAKLSQFPEASKFADTNARISEHHLILDFAAGKDVGLGMFGDKDGSSVLSIGIRFAQFGTKSNIAQKSDPDWHFHYKYIPALLSFGYRSSKIAFKQYYHSNRAQLNATRSFHGIGPSLSWTASAPFAGDLKDGELSADWGVNGALLFGRQRAKVRHQTTGLYHNGGSRFRSIPSRTELVRTFHPTPFEAARMKSVTVPNVGGFAGISYRTENFKVSFGYRADMFFGAMDGGIDARKSENRGFFGPFASISVGLGD